MRMLVTDILRRIHTLPLCIIESSASWNIVFLGFPDNWQLIIMLYNTLNKHLLYILMVVATDMVIILLLVVHIPPITLFIHHCMDAEAMEPFA